MQREQWKTVFMYKQQRSEMNRLNKVLINRSYLPCNHQDAWKCVGNVWVASDWLIRSPGNSNWQSTWDNGRQRSVTLCCYHRIMVSTDCNSESFGLGHVTLTEADTYIYAWNAARVTSVNQPFTEVRTLLTHRGTRVLTTRLVYLSLGIVIYTRRVNQPFTEYTCL